VNDLLAHFKQFDDDNPIVWFYFAFFTDEAIRHGVKKLGGQLIIERVRWEVFIITKGDEFKINNDFTAFYVRKWLCTHQNQLEFFDIRRIRRIECDWDMEGWRRFFGFPP
jgi:hypothetical protein